MCMAFLREFSMGEVLLVLAIILLLFGSKKLPELARALGKSVSEFKKGREEGTAETAARLQENKDAKGPDAKPPAPAQ